MKKDLLYNELAKLTEKELVLVISVCQFIINTLESCIIANSLKQMQEEEEREE